MLEHNEGHNFVSHANILINVYAKNEQVLLRERKRHTARHVASTPYVVLSWLTPPPPAGPDPPPTGWT